MIREPCIREKKIKKKARVRKGGGGQSSGLQMAGQPERVLVTKAPGKPQGSERPGSWAFPVPQTEGTSISFTTPPPTSIYTAHSHSSPLSNCGGNGNLFILRDFIVVTYI